VQLPPLRERMEDLATLAEHFIKKYNEVNGFSVEGFEPGCLDLLRKHTWPGNIRELENAVERAVVLTRGGLIPPGHFSLRAVGESKGGLVRVGMTVEEAERELIQSTLGFCEQNRTKAAQVLGISIRTLRNKLNEYAGRTVAS
jgi:DNA-binding NtrC family response regulator